MISGDTREAVEFQVFESFVKEKYSLLGYVKAMVLYSAKLNGIDESAIAQIYPPEKVMMAKNKEVRHDQDLFNFKNRVIIIVRLAIYNL